MNNDGAAAARAFQAENSATLARLIDLVNRCVEVTIFRGLADESGDPGALVLVCVSPECEQRYIGSSLAECLAKERQECEDAANDDNAWRTGNA